jgi:hypothetical protein
MILVGIIAFYLGIDIRRLHASQVSLGQGIPFRSGMLSSCRRHRNFLTAVAALTSVYAIVFDEDPQPMWEFAVGCCWLLGAMMQIGAGAIGRLRRSTHVVVVVPLSQERPIGFSIRLLHQMRVRTAEVGRSRILADLDDAATNGAGAGESARTAPRRRRGGSRG